MANPALLDRRIVLIDTTFGSVKTVTQVGDDSSHIVNLFADISANRVGFAAHGSEYAFASEWSSFSKEAFVTNCRDLYQFVSDIAPFPAEYMPDISHCLQVAPNISRDEE